MITDQDFWIHEDDLTNPVSQHMTPFNELIFGEEGLSLKDANRLLHKHKKNCLPIVDKRGHLTSLVFKKDYEDHMRHPNELLDNSKRLCVGASVNTHDYKLRVPAMLKAGADVYVSILRMDLRNFKRKALIGSVANLGRRLSLVEEMLFQQKALIIWSARVASILSRSGWEGLHLHY